MFIFKYLLWPFAWLYDLATRIRNYLYDIGHKKSFEFDTVVISVGNLNVGGSGKTPMIEYLIRLLADRYQLATLSRGYGRKTHGIRISSETDNAETLGDEPFQLSKKFDGNIKVVVGEERALAIPTILHQFPEVRIILMDDAFQHRAVKPQFSILVTDYEKPFYKDFLLPFGRLREARKGATRADVIVVTKADGISEAGMELMTSNIREVAGEKPVFFSGLSYLLPMPIHHQNPIGDKVVLVSAIAKNSHFVKEVSKSYQVVKHFRFEDHHHYSEEDIQRIQHCATGFQIDSILTTEKDMVKLITPQLLPLLQNKNWFYLPIRSVFIKGGIHFDEMIVRMVEDKIQELSPVKNSDSLN
jgi:tetraacyldisaccharide 4'-kinase